jgi:isocitrate dehydrogenase
LKGDYYIYIVTKFIVNLSDRTTYTHTHTHTTHTIFYDRSSNYLYIINAKEHKNLTPRQLLPEASVVITAYVIAVKGTLVTT